MCFFKKKKQSKVEYIYSLYGMGDKVAFRNSRGELTQGYIYEIKQDIDGKVIYDVQVGGECPSIHENIPEDKLIKRK